MQCIYNTLIQNRYPNGAALPPWIKLGPQIVVKEFRYDHLTQTISVSDQVPTTLPVPTMRSFIQNEIKLGEMWPGVAIGADRPDRGLSLTPTLQTNACAICSYIAGGFNVADRDKGPDGKDLRCPSRPPVPSGPDRRNATCKACFVLRRPCVFVDSASLNDTGGQFEYIRVPPKFQGGDHNIDGPPLWKVMEEGPVEEEIEGVVPADPEDDSD
jgi:hypothetical protein